MYKQIMRKLCLCFIAVTLFSYGFVSAKYKVFPYEEIKFLYKIATQFSKHLSEHLKEKRHEPTMPFHPAENTVSMVNPPHFSWPCEPEAAGYRIRIRKQGENNPVVDKLIPYNFFIPDQILPPGDVLWQYDSLDVDGKIISTSHTRQMLFHLPEEAKVLLIENFRDIACLIKPHPRVFIEHSIEKFRHRVTHTDTEAWLRFLQKIERSIDAPLEPEPIAIAQAGDNWTNFIHPRLNVPTFRLAHRMLRFAFAYLVTQEHRFSKQAVRIAQHLANWDIKGATSIEKADQAFRMIALALSINYDWTQDAMSPEIRHAQLRAIETRTSILFRVTSKLLTKNPYDSHAVTYMNFLVMIACATVGDIPAAVDWFEFSLGGYFSFMPVWGDKNGGVSQGLVYWPLIAYPMLLAADAIKSTTGIEVYQYKSWLKRTGYVALYFLPPHIKERYFGKQGRLSPGRAEMRIMERLAAAYDNGWFRWYSLKVNDDKQESFFSLGGVERFWWDTSDVKPKPPDDLQQSYYLSDVGWVTMHTSLGKDDDIMLSFKSSPYGSVSHSQGDQNSLVLYAGGWPLLIDSGYSHESSEHRSKFAITTRAHNTVLINGIGQRLLDLSAKGQITDFIDTAEFSYTSGEAGDAYKIPDVRFRRHILHVKNDYFIVFDELSSEEPATYDLLWHSYHPFSWAQKKGGMFLETYNGPWSTTIDILCQDKLLINQSDNWDGYLPPLLGPMPVQQQWHLRLSTSRKCKTQRFLSVIQAKSRDGLPFPIKRVKLDGASIRTVKSDNHFVCMGIRLSQEKSIVYQDIDTDASFFCLRRELTGRWQVFVLGGTYFNSSLTGLRNLGNRSFTILTS